MSPASDVPTELQFVDPAETITTYRVVLWAASGEGKSVAAASAPGPILILSADRPTAYKFSRKHYGQHWVDPETHTRVAADQPDAVEVPAKELRETRYTGARSLDDVYRYIGSHGDVRSVIIDPVSNIVDSLTDELPRREDGDPDYQAVNRKLVGFIRSLRAFDVNVILVAYEKLNDGKRGDGKLYPAIGGPALINKVLGEMDIVAHIERVVSSDGVQRWVGQLQPRGNVVCKESVSGGTLGERRIADLSRWFALASEALAPVVPDDSDLPWADPDPAGLSDLAAATADVPPVTEPTAAHKGLVRLLKARVKAGAMTPEKAKHLLLAAGGSDAATLTDVALSLSEDAAAEVRDYVASRGDTKDGAA